MKEKPVLLLITADDCVYCKPLKILWNATIRNKLAKRTDITIQHINIPTIRAPFPTRYHRELPRFVQWYPTLILVPANLWNNPNLPLQGEVFNGQMSIKGIIVPIEKINSYTEPPIIEWIDKTLLTSSLFRTNNEISNNMIINQENEIIEIIKDGQSSPNSIIYSGKTKFCSMQLK
jgi:thiol-disulfide isomerase/thioredoxin